MLLLEIHSRSGGCWEDEEFSVEMRAKNVRNVSKGSRTS